jgi:hypothetical protein
MKQTLVFIEYETGWAPEAVRTVWKAEKYIEKVGNETPIPRPPSPQPSPYTVEHSTSFHHGKIRRNFY